MIFFLKTTHAIAVVALIAEKKVIPMKTDDERKKHSAKIFEGDLKAAREQFIERMGREPSFDELLAELRSYTHFFYQPCVAFLMILFAFAEL